MRKKAFFTGLLVSVVLVATAENTPSATLTDGLAACWHFNSSNTLLRDLGPHRTAFVNMGGVTFDANESPYGNGSAYFNGSAYLQLLNGGYPPDGPVGSEPFTFACWFKADPAISGARQLFAFGQNSNGNIVGFRLESDRRKLLSYLWGPGVDSYVYPTDGTDSFAEGWHSVVHVWDGTTFKIFIDGVSAELIPSNNTMTRTAATAPDIIPYTFRLGWSLNSNKWGGWIDEAALWNRALTADEIAAYISGGVPVDESTFPGNDYVITSAMDAMPSLSGSDKLTVNIPVGTVFNLSGDNSGWHGVLDVVQGVVVIPNAATLGSSVIYCTNETFAANNANNARLEFAGSMTVANEIHLGTETTVSYGPRLLVTSGDVVLAKPLYTTKSILAVSNGTLTFAGPVTCSSGTSYNDGAYLVLKDALPYYDSRIRVTGKLLNFDTLFVHGSGTGVRFLTPGQGVKWPVATHGGTIVCDVNNVFPSVNIISRSMYNIDMSYLDLNGTSQRFNNNDHQVWDSGLRVRNSNANAKGTLIVTQTRENAASNLTAVGPLDFVKEGSEMLVITNHFHISGTLDVVSGTLKFTGPQTTIASQVVVRAGATLDLGGNAYRCQELSLQGGVVCNGTLMGITNVLVSGRVGATIAGGVTVKEGLEAASLEGGLASGHSTLTNGLVCCYHFDSADSLLQDSGPYGYTLANCWTNSNYRVNASLGPVTFDASNGRYGSGSAFFAEHVFLSYPGGYPAKAPRGRAPLTIAFWFRLVDGSKGRGKRGLCYFGNASNGHGLGMVMWNNATGILNYMWGPLNDMYVSPTGGESDFCGAWHSLVQVWDGSQFHVYIDGAESTQTPREASCTRTKGTPIDIIPTVFFIGTGYNNPYLAGWMDEVAMWDRALTMTEIEEYIENGVYPDESRERTPAVLKVDAGTVRLSSAPGDDTLVTLDVGANGMLQPIGSELRFGGTLCAGGTMAGDLTLKDGAIISAETNRTMNVSGVVTAIGTGSLVPESAVASIPAVWTPFTATGGYSGSFAGWTVGGVPGTESRFRIDGTRLNAIVYLPGTIMIVR